MLVWMTLAAIAGEVQHQGRLLDNTGSPVSGSHDLTFTLYDSGGQAIGSPMEVNGVSVAAGHYSVVLNAPDASWATAASIAIQVDGGAELQPQYTLFDVPNAIAIGGQTLSDLDERYEVGVSVGSARPGSPQVGTLFLNTSTLLLELYDGTRWRPLSEAQAPIGEVTAMFSNEPPDGFVWMDGQTLNKASSPELKALVDHLQAMGLGTGDTAMVPNWNDGRVLVSAGATLTAANASQGASPIATTLTLNASGTTTIPMNQFDHATTRNGGSFAAGSVPALTWPTFRMPSHSHTMSHTHSDGSYVAAIGSAGGNIGSLAFAASNDHVSNDCTYTITGGAITGCQSGYRNHNTDVKGTSGGASTSSTGSTGGTSSSHNTTQSGGSWSAGTLPALTWPGSYDLAYGASTASGTTTTSGTVAMDPRRAGVRYAIRYR